MVEENYTTSFSPENKKERPRVAVPFR